MNRIKIKQQIDKLEAKIHLLTQYLRLKLEEEDWHGVEDAASDIRDVVAQINVLTELLVE